MLFVCFTPTASAEQYTVLNITTPTEMIIYQPPLVEGEVYPVLYLFHGQWQHPDIWEDIGVLDTLDSLLDAGEIVPFYVVMPREVAYMQDMYESEFYDLFLETVMPFVEANYPVSTDRDLTAVGGVSRGSLWAQFFAFTQYGRFGNVGVHSPPNAFFSTPKIYRLIQDAPETPYLRIRIDIGNNDYQVRTGQGLSDQLTELFYPHEFHLGVGGHDVEYWSANIRDYLLWYSEGFEKAGKR